MATIFMAALVRREASILHRRVESPPVDPIEAVHPERVARGDARMLEVLVRVLHADALHHRPRAQVGEGGERDDLGEADPLEAGAERGTRRLAGQAAAPEAARQPPADLDAGRARQGAPRHAQADEADELAALHELARPVAPALAFELPLPEVDARVARFAALQAPGSTPSPPGPRSAPRTGRDRRRASA
jgi:hypothetical protein